MLVGSGRTCGAKATTQAQRKGAGAGGRDGGAAGPERTFWAGGEPARWAGVLRTGGWRTKKNARRARQGQTNSFADRLKPIHARRLAGWPARPHVISRHFMSLPRLHQTMGGGV